MIKKYFIFYFLVLFAGQATARPNIEDQFIVSKHPEVLRQYQTSWCYAFSSKALLQQAFCKKNDCSKGNADIGLATILHLSSKGTTWFKGGNQDEILEKLSTNKSIIRSSCTQEKELMKFHSSKVINPKSDSIKTQLSILYTTFQKDLIESTQSVNDFLPRWISNYSKAVDDAIDITFIERALRESNDLTNFIDEVIYPSECVDKSISLPSFQVHKSLEKSVDGVLSSVNTALNNDAVVSLSICASAFYRDAVTDCGPHSVSITGRRNKCENNNCELEFRLYDSGQFPQTKQNLDGTFWVNAQFLGKAALKYANFTKEINSGINTNLNSSIQALKDLVINFESQILSSKIKEEKAVSDLLIIIGELYQSQFNDTITSLRARYAELRDGLRGQIKRLKSDISKYDTKSSNLLTNMNNVVWIELN